jgi:multiple sugar transport system substrate-binding protein
MLREASRSTRTSRRRAIGAAGALGVPGVLAGVLAGGLGACTVGSQPSGPASAPSGSVDWVVWNTTPVWDRVAAQFTKQTPAITVNVSRMLYEEMYEKLTALGAAGTAPDLFMASPVDVAPFADNKVYRPIDAFAKRERGWTDRYYPVALDTFRVRGALYGVWHYANPQVVFYNKELLAKSGAKEPPADWTYQQWLDLSTRVTRRAEPATSVWGTDAPTTFNHVFNAVRSFGGSLFDSDEDPKRFTGNSAKALEGLQFLADLLLKHRVAPTAADAAGQGNLFYTGRQAFRTVIVLFIAETRRELTQAWDIAPLPRGPAGRFAFYGANGTAFTVPASKSPEPAWAFMRYLGGVEGQREYLAEFGALPTLKSLAENDFVRQPAPPANLRIVPDVMAYTKSLPKLPSPQIQPQLNAAFSSIWSGQKSPGQAMADVEGPMNQLLRG